MDLLQTTLAALPIIGGLIFGYSTGVIAGALPSIESHFNLTSTALIGLLTASILIGAFAGSMSGGFFADRYGRKVCVIVLGIFAAGGSLFASFAPNYWLLVIARAITGIGVGLSTFACPAYVSEVSPPERRGFYGTFFQLAITFGILFSYLMNLAFNGVGGSEKDWRYMFGFGSLFGVAALLLGLVMPESPEWLRRKNGEFQPLIPEKHQEINRGLPVSGYVPSLRSGLIIGELLAAAQQLTGINAFMYYAVSIFESAGLSNPIVPTIGLGAWNFVTTFASTFFVDRLGRRPLLLVGISIMTVSTVLLALVYHILESFPKAVGAAAVLLLLVFVLGFEIGLGPLFWVVATELFPVQHKGIGLSTLNASTWLFNIILTVLFPILRTSMGFNVYFIFAAVGAVCTALLFFLLPETKTR